MDEVTQHVRAFMVSMEQVRDELGQIVRELYQRPDIVRLAKQYNPAPYPSFDLGVSVDLHYGAVVDLWLEVEYTEAGWSVHPTVKRHDVFEDGSHTERDLGLRMVSDAGALPRELTQALRELRGVIGDEGLFRKR
jgi:hypothetical protein